MVQGPESSHEIAHSAHLGGALLGAVLVGLSLRAEETVVMCEVLCSVQKCRN